MRVSAFLVVLLVVILPMIALADVPGLMNYQGTLTDGNGVALDTTVSMTFTIYTDSTGGSSLWTETQSSVVVNHGLFNVLLGRVNAISDTVFKGVSRWLGVQVESDPELEPRQRIASVGYAFRAAEADTADYARSGLSGSDGDWTIVGNDMYSGVSGNVGVGTTSPQSKLQVNGAIRLGTGSQKYQIQEVTPWSGGGWRNYIDFGGIAIGSADGTQKQMLMFTDGVGSNNIFTVVTSENGGSSWEADFVVQQDGKVGIGTTSPAERLDVSGNIHASGTLQSGSSITIDGGSNQITSSGDLEVHINSGRALKLESNATSPNLILGYSGNSVSGGVLGATIGGGGHSGSPNNVTGNYSTVGGGHGNTASSDRAFVGGGQDNTASSSFATVGGGWGNEASNPYSAVGGGSYNDASGQYAAVGGGDQNVASGNSATVAGGGQNTAGGDYSFAAGRRAKANHNGAFVWGDNTDADFASTGANQFLIRATGGVGIGTTTPSATLHISGGKIYVSDAGESTGIQLADSWIGDHYDGLLHIRSGGEVVTFDGGDNVGIGTTTPVAKLDVSGDVNTATLYKIGGSAVLSVQDQRSTFVGIGAGANKTYRSVDFVTFLGYHAGSNDQGINNTFIGCIAGSTNTTGSGNIFVGGSAGYSNTTGGGNTFVGWRAGRLNETGVQNTCLGNQAGAENTGSYNTFLGTSAGFFNEGTGNTFSGWGAGHSNTSGRYNTFIGTSAGYLNTIGNYNTFIGRDAGGLNNSNSKNVFVGYGAGYSNTDSCGTFMGFGAGYNNEGFQNTFIGCVAGSTNTTGYINTFLGYKAGHGNTTGYWNTFLGAAAGAKNETGVNNTFLGAGAGLWHMTGHNNTFLGTSAGGLNSTGSGNVFIGTGAGYGESGSNKLYIANDTDTSDVLIYGDFSTGKVGLGTLAPAEILHLNKSSGSLGMRISSDASSYQYMNFGATNGYGMGCDSGDRFFINREQPLGSGVLRILTIPSSGNVGIGTTSPARPLHVDDVMRLEPRVDFPSSASDGDLCVKGTAGGRHIYCYLNGDWRQLD